jgi:hypothetical protein
MWVDAKRWARDGMAMSRDPAWLLCERQVAEKKFPDLVAEYERREGLGLSDWINSDSAAKDRLECQR